MEGEPIENVAIGIFVNVATGTRGRLKVTWMEGMKKDIMFFFL